MSTHLDTDAMALQLVKDGKASPMILGHGLRPHELDGTRGEGADRDSRSAVDPPIDNFLSLHRDGQRDVTLGTQRHGNAGGHRG